MSVTQGRKRRAYCLHEWRTCVCIAEHLLRYRRPVDSVRVVRLAFQQLKSLRRAGHPVGIHYIIMSPVGGRADVQRGVAPARCPRWGSNPHCGPFKGPASADWATGAFAKGNRVTQGRIK